VTDPVSALVLRVADGDREAFDALYDAIAPRVDALCARILGPGPDAEDAAQQALCGVFERSTEYDPHRGPAWGWILTLTCWEARTARRRRERRRETGEVPERSVAPDEGGLGDLLALVDDDDRRVIVAALELAHRPDVAPATFRKRWQRALHRLRVGLGWDGGGR
jgi:RNA polymerase sigma-70 factor (ECF subfamily)